jgi:hypothetical protein
MADDQLLTRDNSLLSRPTIEPPDGPRAADGTLWDIGVGCFVQVPAQKTLQAEVEVFIQAGDRAGDRAGLSRRMQTKWPGERCF